MKEKGNLQITCRGEKLCLLPEKAIIWKKESTLILADLHLGKVTHFRKAGIAVPAKAKHVTIDNLEDLLLRYLPDKVLILGDLFHSAYNEAWLQFNDLIERYPEVQFLLVEGNHDILEKVEYEKSRLMVYSGFLESGPFLFSHEPLDHIPEDNYNMCGHIHPAVLLKGKGRQSLRLSCFYFGDHTCILPAFGTFTGSHVINPLPGERIFIPADGKVISL